MLTSEDKLWFQEMMDSRFDRIDKRLNEMDERIGKIDRSLYSHNYRMEQSVDSIMYRMKNQFDSSMLLTDVIAEKCWERLKPSLKSVKEYE